MRAVALLLIALAVAGCAREPRYQMIQTRAGAIARLDTKTGEVILIEKGPDGLSRETVIARPGDTH